MAGLAGRRLELRPLGDADAEALAAAVDASRDSLKRRLRWVSAAQGAAESLAFIRASREDAARGSRLVFGVFEAKGGALAGLVALQGLTQTPGLAELAGWVRADRLERGYASEAGKLLIAHAFRKDALHRLYARIDPANRAARKVLRKLGFRYEGCLRHEKRLNGRWINQECWGMLRSEWKK